MTILKGKIEATHGGKIPIVILELIHTIAPKILDKTDPNINELAGLGERLTKRTVSEEHFMKLLELPTQDIDPKKSACKFCKLDFEQLHEGACADCWDEHTSSHSASPSALTHPVDYVKCKGCQIYVNHYHKDSIDFCDDCYEFFVKDRQPSDTVNSESEKKDEAGKELEEEQELTEVMKQFGGWAPWSNNPIEKMLT